MQSIFNISRLVNELQGTFKRYPFPSAALLLLLGVINFPFISGNSDVVNIMMNYGSVIILFFYYAVILSYIFNSRKNRTWYSYLSFVGLVGLAIYYAYPFLLYKNELLAGWPQPDFTPIAISKYYALMLVSVLGIICMPFFIGKRTNVDFWNHAIQLLNRLIVSGFFSGVLTIGLWIAVSSLEFLFDVRVGTAYFRVFLSVGVVFNLWYNLGGITEPVDLPKDPNLSAWALVITRVTLAPLLVLYFAILSVYVIKIVVLWQLPDGMVALPMLVYSAIGVLVFFLLHPEQENAKLPWVAWISRFFFYTLPPFLVLLGISIYVRIDEYGVTIPRFTVASVFVWLVLIDLLFIVKPKSRLAIIPLSLMVFLLIGYVGLGTPLAISVSQSSQVKYLMQLFEKNHAVQSGKLIKLDKAPEDTTCEKLVYQFQELPLNDSAALSGIIEEKAFKEIMIGYKNQEKKNRDDFDYMDNLATYSGHYLLSWNMNQYKSDLVTKDTASYSFKYSSETAKNNYNAGNLLAYFDKEYFHIGIHERNTESWDTSYLAISNHSFIRHQTSNDRKLHFNFYEDHLVWDTVVDLPALQKVITSLKLDKKIDTLKDENNPKGLIEYSTASRLFVFKKQLKNGSKLFVELNSWSKEPTYDAIDLNYHYSPADKAK